MKNLRAAAAHIIFLVTHEGYSLSDSLPEILSSFPDSRDQALIQALCYGVCRRYFYLTALLNLLLDKPLKYADKDLHALLLVGLYQLSDMRIPAYAAVDDTVAATQDLQKAWAKGLVNAILRNFLRNPSGFTQALANNKEALLVNRYA
jgi:16S rRNA (cytosine967-C5)-methyltransferase